MDVNDGDDGNGWKFWVEEGEVVVKVSATEREL